MTQVLVLQLKIIENAINSELNNLNCWLKANRLSLNIIKTEFMVIGSRQRIQAHCSDQVNIEYDGNQIMKVDEAKSLGLIIDKHLTWSRHIEEKSKKISSVIGARKRPRELQKRVLRSNTRRT